MGRLRSRWPRRVWLGVAALAVAALAAPALAGHTRANSYVVHRLVSDIPGRAAKLDPDLVNGWGLAALPTSPWWVADNGTDRSTIYTADGTKQGLVVGVDSAPTGMVANVGPNFVVSNGTNSGSAKFLFATEKGKILGWSPSVDVTHAVVGADRSNVGAIYKGLAIDSAADRIYAADFHNGRVDVFDANFALITSPGAFVDPQLDASYAPFGIQTIGTRIFVTYAKQDADAEDEVAGQGRGFVDVYSTAGDLLGRVAQHGQLNAPWGLALAPSNFGRFSGDLLVGNFGDGQINAYEEMANGRFEHRGELRDADGRSLSIDGLWALQFGHGAPNNGPTNTLFFTAGPNDESDGLFGSITAP